LRAISFLKSNPFWRNSAGFWAASLAVAFINYLYYPILGRFMHPADFGETQTVMSIFTQMAVFFQVLGLVSIGIITKYPDEEIRTKIINEISRLALIASLVLLTLIAILSPLLKSFFHFQAVTPFIALACSLLFSVPLAFSNSYLQGHKRFWTLSISNLLLSIGRIICSLAFVLFGFRTLGAVGGLICAQLLALLYSLRKGKGIRHFVANNAHIRKPQLPLIKAELPFVATVFITSLTTNLLLSLDILVVKHYFPPSEAGFYTGISIIANIVYFVTGPFAGVLIPSINATQEKRESNVFLRRSLFMMLPIGGAITLLFMLAPHFVVTLLLGSKFASYAMYLRGLSLALFLLSIANLLIYYHIGLRHYLIAPVVGVGLIFSVLLLQYRHASMGLVVGDLEVGALFILVLVSGLLIAYSEPLLSRKMAVARQ
jgi:O-antigen/teichoic acid export membrane protein